MEAKEIKKKLTKVKSLYSEYSMLRATVNACKKVDKKGLVTLDENYLHNMEKRIGIIEKQFDTIFK
jgi:hypothetical protein